MVLLLNIESGRDLREGDEVRVLTGPRSGAVGKVVGFALQSTSPVVVQYPAPRAGVVREEFGANDVTPVGGASTPESLEPLPDIDQVLTDGAKATPCGTMLYFLTEDGPVTFVPKDPQHILGDLFEADLKSGKSFGEALNRLRDGAFVTRLPHLTNSAMSQNIDALIEAHVTPEVALQHLLSQA